MGKKKDSIEYIPKQVKVRVHIRPAFALTIEDDSTGKQWSGHTWYGDSAMDTLRRMRTTLKMGEYKNDELKVTSSTPELVAATGWKEATFDTK